MREIVNLCNGWEFALVRGMEAELINKEPENDAYCSVMLPHDWAVSSPFNRDMKQGKAQGFLERWGVGWYRRVLQVNKTAGQRYYLCFDGIFEDSTVWINGIHVGGRKYGYSNFELDVTEVLTDGKNGLLVRVNNTSFPADRWYSGAGIYRKVTLVTVPKQHLVSDNVRTEISFLDTTAILTITTGATGNVWAELKRNEKTYTAAAGEDGILTICVPEYEAWSAEHPALYELTLRLKEEVSETILDELSWKIGFRKVELSPEHGLFVNGQSVKLKGVCVHQDVACFGTAVTAELWKERLLALKQIGCNTIRLAHHLYFPEMLDLCDELGFYVYEECFDKWTGGAYGRYYETEWKRDIETMVLRDRHHACILFWGIGNEVENQAYPSMLKHLKEHVALVRSMDTRPVSLALNPHLTYPGEEVDLSQISDIQEFVDETKEGEIIRMEDRVRQTKKMADCVDLLCCNYQEQWYDELHRGIPDKAILGTETYMYFRREYRMMSGTLMEKNPWQDVEERDYCIGSMIWTGIDYWGESMDYPSKGWSGSLFSMDMEKRQPAWLMQCYWTEEPVIHFDVMDMSLPDEAVKGSWDAPRYVSHWEFPQFTRAVIPYVITTNCEDVLLIVGSKEYAVMQPDRLHRYLWTGYLPYESGKVTVIGKNNGIEVCRCEVNTPSMAVQLRFDNEEQEITLASDGMPYQLLAKVRAYDAEGYPVFRESANVQFVAEGPVELAGVVNGDLKSSEPCTENRIHLYCGKAAVGIRILKEGRIRIGAFAGGMEAGYMTIIAKKRT